MRLVRSKARNISELTINQDIPMAGYKLTGLGAGSSNGHSIRYNERYTDAKALAAGIAGGLSNVIWKDASEVALSDTNRTGALAFTDLDLTAYTSADAKYAILLLRMVVDSVSEAAFAALQIRKNGTTPDDAPRVYVGETKGDKAYGASYCFAIIAMDADEVIEYTIAISGTIQVDSFIAVLGYIE